MLILTKMLEANVGHLLKAAVHGKCKQLECLHLQAYKQISMNEFPWSNKFKQN